MLNKEVLESIFEKLLSQAKKSYDEFNVVDGKIGDGDLGIAILNGFEEINNNINKFSDDMGANFSKISFLYSGAVFDQTPLSKAFLETLTAKSTSL